MRLALRVTTSAQVKRHCSQMHRGEPLLVLRQPDAAPGTDGADGADGAGAVVVTGEGATAAGDGEDEWVREYITKLTSDDNLQKCLVCGYTQYGASSLKRHVLARHLRFYPYECAYCGVKQVSVWPGRAHLSIYKFYFLPVINEMVLSLLCRYNPCLAKPYLPSMFRLNN